MACTSVKAYTKNCGKGVSGGIQKLYVIGIGDIPNYSGGTTNFTFASGTTIVNNVNVASGKTFVEIGILAESVTYKGTAKRKPFYRFI